jgi:hypothetical protein
MPQMPEKGAFGKRRIQEKGKRISLQKCLTTQLRDNKKHPATVHVTKRVLVQQARQSLSIEQSGFLSLYVSWLRLARTE